MVCKFKFVRYGHIKKIALFGPWFNSESPVKSNLFHLKILRFFNFQDMDPKLVLVLHPRVLKRGGSSLGIRPSIYVLKGCYKEPPQKGAMTGILGAKAFFIPPLCILLAVVCLVNSIRSLMGRKKTNWKYLSP